MITVLLKGSLTHENRERKAPAVVFVRPHEDAFQIQAGPEGLAALILNFPRAAVRRLAAWTQRNARWISAIA